MIEGNAMKCAVILVFDSLRPNLITRELTTIPSGSTGVIDIAPGVRPRLGLAARGLDGRPLPQRPG